MIEFRSFNPARRDELVKAMGPKIAVKESPWDCLMFAWANHEKKPSTTRACAARSASPWIAGRAPSTSRRSRS